MSKANRRSIPQYLGYVVVGSWEHIILKIESILEERNTPLCQLMKFIIDKCSPVSIKS